MAILSGYERRKKTVADANGDHKLVSEWTHPVSVEFDGGYTLAESTKCLTQAEYDALSEEEQNCGIEYIITDAEISSSAIEYDNTTSKLNATDMQEAIDEVALPTYTEASSLTALKSGEGIKTAFGKLSKAVSSYISHLADKVSHITSTERTKWNGYESSIATNTTAISSLNSDLSELNTDKADVVNLTTNIGTFKTVLVEDTMPTAIEVVRKNINHKSGRLFLLGANILHTNNTWYNADITICTFASNQYRLIINNDAELVAYGGQPVRFLFGYFE